MHGKAVSVVLLALIGLTHFATPQEDKGGEMPFARSGFSLPLPQAAPTGEAQLMAKLEVLDNLLASVDNLKALPERVEALLNDAEDLNQETRSEVNDLRVKLVAFQEAQASSTGTDGSLEKEVATLRDEVNQLKAQMVEVLATQAKVAAAAPAAAPKASSGGSTGGNTSYAPTVSYTYYPTQYSVPVAAGGSTGGSSYSPANNYPTSNGQAVYCVDQFGNQVPCAQGTQTSNGTTAGPLKRFFRR